MRMAPIKEFQPSITGKECKRARSRGRRPLGARRAWTRARISASSGVLVGGGSGTYGRRISLGILCISEVICNNCHYGLVTGNTRSNESVLFDLLEHVM